MRLNCRGEEIYYGCEMLFPAGSPPISASVVPMPTIEEEVILSTIKAIFHIMTYLNFQSESELQLTIHRFSKILRDKSTTEGGADRRQKSSSSCCSSRDSAASSSLSGPSCSSAAAESDSMDGGDSDGCWSGRRKSGESTQRSALTELDLDDYIDDDISSDDEIASVQSGRFKVSSASRSAGDPPQNGHCLLIKGQN